MTLQRQRAVLGKVWALGSDILRRSLGGILQEGMLKQACLDSCDWNVGWGGGRS